MFSWLNPKYRVVIGPPSSGVDVKAGNADLSASPKIIELSPAKLTTLPPNPKASAPKIESPCI